jgi:hypothetical protein
MTRIEASLRTLSVAAILCAPATTDAAGVASPTVTGTTGNVTITYGDITINRSVGVQGPSRAQIQAVVQQVISQNLSLTTAELEAVLEDQLDVLDGIARELGQLRLQIAEHTTRDDDRLARLSRKLTEISDLLDRGQVAEARDSLGEIYDITRTGRTSTLRAVAQSVVRGTPLRLFTISFLQSYDLMVWPEHIGSSSFAIGWGISLGGGSAQGGYASPAPDHALISSREISVGTASARGTLSWMFRRDHLLQLLTSLEFEAGVALYDSTSDQLSGLNTGMYSVHVLQGIATRVSGRSYMTVAASVGFEPWAHRPVFAYSGLGAAYEPPRSFRGIDVGITISYNMR